MTVAANLAGSLREHGVRRVFGVPSESFTLFMDALLDEPEIGFVAARQEGGAAFMAEAYAAASGEIGVVLGGRAVGASNLAIGVHTARENSTPMLVLVGQVDSRHRGREAFQEAALADFLRPLAKHAVEEADPRRMPETVARALRLAVTGRPGPVVLSLPEDVFAGEVDAPPARPARIPRPRPSAAEAGALHALIDAAERPLIIAGAGVRLSGAEERLREFAEHRGLPVVLAWRRHEVFPCDHPLYAGHLQLGAHPEIVRTVREADVLLAFGTRLGEITSQRYTAITPAHRIAQIDVEPAMIGKSHPVELGVVADLGEALAALLAGGPPPREPSAWTRERHAAAERAAHVPVEEHGDRVDNRQIIRMLRDGLPGDAVITNDAGNFSGWLHAYFPFREPRTYVGAASGAMGYGLPAAVGAQLAHPGRDVVSLSGDGGFLMTVQELETAVRLRLPIVSLVFNNNMYGTIRMHQERRFPARTIGTDLGNPDLVALAESFGAFGALVTADAEFPSALRAALAQDRPSVVEIRTDPEQISVWRTLAELRGER